MKDLYVKIPSVPQSGYSIEIAAGNLSSVYDRIIQDYSKDRLFLVTDANLIRAGIVKSFLGDENIPTHVIDPPGESTKHIQTVVAIIEQMEKVFLGRDAVVIALGGGTVGDIAGFAAAIFKRGVKVIHIPTTTVSQADSSVGGKTGVDSTISKNAFGAFWHPQRVFIDVLTLNTLDDRQYRAGLAESVKHALIADCEYFELFEQKIQQILERQPDILQAIAYTNCSIKASVVEEDPTEKNKRRILNYGHTIGHAVESASDYSLLHGECVAIGMIAAGLIEQQLNMAQEDRMERIKSVLRKLDLPLAIPKEINKDTLIDILKRDKKAVGKWPKFILLENIGNAKCSNGQWAHDVPREIVEGSIDKLYG